MLRHLLSRRHLSQCLLLPAKAQQRARRYPILRGQRVLCRAKTDSATARSQETRPREVNSQPGQLAAAQ
jgi:hypothetical protein